MGGYGFIRFSLPMFPEGSAMYVPFVFVLSGIAVIYTSLVALVQRDMKKLIAYSSVAHMAFVTFGLFAMNRQGLEGAMMVMLSHGLVSGALFLIVGVVYDRLHTRDIDRYGGLANNMPRYAVVFMLMMLASVGLPGTSGFVGEFLVLLGAFRVTTWFTAIAALGLILGAAYMLLLYRRVVFGVIDKDDVRRMPDLSPREILVFAPIVVVVLWMGIYPSSFLKPMQPSLTALVERVETARKQAALGAERRVAQQAPSWPGSTRPSTSLVTCAGCAQDVTPLAWMAGSSPAMTDRDR
jgi:NADH-quinone oxidoreductase subunit M